MPTPWSRRDVLWALGASGACAQPAASLLPSGRAAQGSRAAASPRNLIVVQAYGGWDTLYSIDPKPDSSWMSVPEGELRQFGNIPIWTAESRPETTAFFERHHQRVAVAHGINVRSVDHVQCLRWMLTGTRDPLAPDVCAIASEVLGRDYPLPFLLLSELAFLGPFAGNAARAGGVNQIAALVSPGTTYAPVDGTVPLEPTAGEAAAIDAYRMARAAAPVGVIGPHVSAREDTWRARERAKVLRSLGASLGEPGFAQDLAAQILAAADILQDGLSRAVMLDSQVFFDTHGDNTLQVAAQEEVFLNLALLFDELEARPGREGGSLFDETVVAVVSEMGRSPTLNDDEGKDHWPYSSVLLAGGGIRGDVVLGGSSDDTFLGRRVDLDSGEIDDAGEEVYAERLTAGLLEAVGVDPEAWLPGVPVFRGFREP